MGTQSVHPYSNQFELDTYISSNMLLGVDFVWIKTSLISLEALILCGGINFLPTNVPLNHSTSSCIIFIYFLLGLKS